MNKIFEKALDFTIPWEGFISNDVEDFGKLTIWGISSKYNPEEVKMMKRLIDEGDKNSAFQIAKECYRKKYWLRAGCYKYEDRKAIVMFEFAVLPGIGALEKAFKEEDTWKDLLLKRIRYFSNKNNKKYIRGWVRRCVDLYDFLEERW